MPIFEYECKNCGDVHEFTVFTKNEQDNLVNTRCHECNGPLRRIVSLSSFHLKGGGWEKDGYVNSNSG